MNTVTFIVVAIVIGVFIAIVGYRIALHTPPAMETTAKQAEIIYQYIKVNPILRNFFAAAEQDGATHVNSYGYDGIAFYRVCEGMREVRILSIPERPDMGKVDWVGNWEKSDKLPPDVIPISDAHVNSYF